MPYGANQIGAMGDIGVLINRLYGPGALSGATNALYQNWLQSPAFTSAYNEIIRSASGARYRMGTALNRRGMTPGSGMSLAARSFAPSAATSGLAGLYAGGYQTALGAAGQNIGQRSATFGYGTQGLRWPDPNQPGFWERLGGYGAAAAGYALPALAGGGTTKMIPMLNYATLAGMGR